MPGYVKKLLKHFQHQPPLKPQNQQNPHIPPKYRAKVQYAELEDIRTTLNKDDKQFIKEVTGTFVFYTRAIDSTMLMVLHVLASKQANPTEAMMKKCKQFLDCKASQEETIVTHNPAA